MRILIASGADRGGFAVYTERLARRLEAEGVDVRVTAPGDWARGAPPLPSVRWGDDVAGWSRLRLRSLRAKEVPRRAVALMRAARAVEPDVVHLQTTVARHLDPWLMRSLGNRQPVVLTAHNPVPHEGGDREVVVEQRRWRSAAAVVVHGSIGAREVAAREPGVPVWTIPVDLLAERRFERHDARRRLGLGDGPAVGVVGMLRPYKGLDILHEAWPAVRRARPDARLYVVGSAPEPFAALEALTALEGVERRDGWLSDAEIDLWAAGLDLGLLPYRHGSHSGVLHRHVAHLTPVLTSPCLTEEVSRFRAGRTVALDPQAWTDALLRTLGPDPVPPPVPGTGRQARLHVSLYESLTRRSPSSDVDTKRSSGSRRSAAA